MVNDYTGVNNIVHCAMSAAHLPSRLEPTGLSRSDGKCPNVVTLVPWRSGRLLVWDTTCLYTFAPSHLPSATREADAVAALAKQSKQEKYAALNQHYNFTPVAIETAGHFGSESLAFLRNWFGVSNRSPGKPSHSPTCGNVCPSQCNGEMPCCSDGNYGGHHLPF